jgi:hypothetical protein
MSQLVIDFCLAASISFIEKTYTAHRLDCEFGYDPSFSSDTVEKLIACENFIDYVDNFKN